MAYRPFRFVHASDLHLECVPQGVPEIPAPLRAPFRDAPFAAALRLFDAVLAEEADFLLLAGDVVDCHAAGLRGSLFLCEQFHRLAAAGVNVYWAGGQVDSPESWPTGLRLPANVHRFPTGRPATFVHSKDGAPLCQIVGASRDARRDLTPAELTNSHGELFSIAVRYGRLESSSLTGHLIDYWALGGGHAFATLTEDEPRAAIFPGTPQGRTPDERGAHGAVVVDVDPERGIHPRFITTDALRYWTDRVAIGPTTTSDDLAGELFARCAALRQANADLDIALRFTIGCDRPVGDTPLALALRKGPLAADLLTRLRNEFGQERPAVWTVVVDVEPTLRLTAKRQAEGTMLGDLLGFVDECLVELADGAPPAAEPLAAFIDLAPVAGPHALADDWPLAGYERAPRRREVLAEVAGLSIDLLGGEESST